MPAGSTSAAASEPLSVGTTAPEFTLLDQHGADTALSSSAAAGKAALLVFYPFAFTGTCTGELTAMRERLAELSTPTTDLLAVSCDARFSLRVFADREQLTFPVLSDFWPHGEVSRAYGVFEESRGCAVRATFLIDRTGVVVWSVVNQIPYARDVDAYVQAIADLDAQG